MVLPMMTAEDLVGFKKPGVIDFATRHCSVRQ